MIFSGIAWYYGDTYIVSSACPLFTMLFTQLLYRWAYTKQLSHTTVLDIKIHHILRVAIHLPFTPIEKRANFSPNCTVIVARGQSEIAHLLSSHGALTNQVKLRPSNERPRRGYASFSLATVENGCTVGTLALFKSFLYPSSRNTENQTIAWQKKRWC